MEDALTHYKQALVIKPNYAEAHCNLGSVFQDLEQIQDARTHYEQALVIKPDFVEAHYNLGYLFYVLGEQDKAYRSSQCGITFDPDNKLCWSLMARSLESILFTSADDILLQELCSLLEQSTVSPNSITHTVMSALYCNPDFELLLKHVNNEELESSSYVDAAKLLSSLPLLLKIMSLTCINDLEVEKMVTNLRRSMLLELKHKNFTDCENNFQFSIALALNCFTNEYVFQETMEEENAIEELCKTIDRLVINKQEIQPSLLITLACYRPLNKFTWASELLERDWSDDFIMVIDQQVGKPRKEKVLRNQISKLTPIQNNISKSVRNQYEENPYPRWISAGLRDKPKIIKEELQAYPLKLDLSGYVSPQAPEILIAGCGTGQHALVTASRFTNAHVLAIDLSLSSLSYALRKTEELKFSTIEYAQADIMELGSLGKQFDLIESVGVLHHLNDPLAGWRILTNLLCQGGLMKIGLYSEIARQDVICGHQLIKEKGYSSSSKDMRICRQDIISQAKDGNQQMEKISSRKDFFSLSEFRDLLFHVQENRYTIPQLETELEELGLNFLGFEFKNPKVLAQFKTKYSEKTVLSSLSLWHEFETQNPSTFKGMYQFWVQKK